MKDFIIMIVCFGIFWLILKGVIAFQNWIDRRDEKLFYKLKQMQDKEILRSHKLK